MRDRIRLIMENERMTQQEFANLLDVSPASLSSVFNGRTKPTNNHVTAIHKHFPKISISWLLFGEGSMCVSDGTADESASGDVVSSLSSDCQNGMSSKIAQDADVLKEGLFGQQYAAQNRKPQPGVVAPPLGVNDVPVARFYENGRRIKEIRVFYSDGTYESFAPAGK